MARINVNAIRRHQIVEAAIDVIARKGWNRASISEITKNAGVSRGLVSYHFKDKGDLLISVLERCRQSYQNAVQAAISSGKCMMERMRFGINRAIELIREDPINYEVLIYAASNSHHNPELRNKVQELWSEFDRNTANSIRSGQNFGVFRRELTPDVAAVIVNSTIAGLALRWLIAPGTYSFEEVAKEAEGMLIDFLTRGAGSTLPNEQRVAEDGARSSPLTAKND